jgi:ribosome recycling factor
LTKSVGNLSEEVNSRVNAHTGQTRKELDKQGQEIINGSKVIISNIREHKAVTESSVEKLKQTMTQSRERDEDRFKEMSGEVRSSIGECENKIQSVKQANE